MNFSNLFRKDKRPPKEVEKVFEKMRTRLEGRKLTDEAISYRNLGEYDKAYRLLMEAIEKYQYLPAITLIGTTALLKGDFDKAIEWFETNINFPPTGSGLLVIEWYANLGVIYLYKKQEIEKARATFEKALSIPKPPEEDDVFYNAMISGIHRDIAAAYFLSGKISLAAEYARKRLAFNPDCETGKKVLESCEKHNIQNIPQLINNPPCGTITFSQEGKATLIASGGWNFPSGSQRLIHALGHQLLHMLYELLRDALPIYREQCKNDIYYIENWAGVVDSKWTNEQDERFARQYELYVSISNSELQLQPPLGELLDPGLCEIFKRESAE